MDTRMPTGTLPNDPSATPSMSSLDWKIPAWSQVGTGQINVMPTADPKGKV
jgi:hypothetical protein